MGFAMFANFVGNVFTNPVAAVKVLFYDMAITVLQYMQNIASAVEGLINMIPGVTVDLTSGLGGWITDLAKKRSDEIQNSGYTEYVKPWENMDLGSAYTRGYDWGSNLSLGNLFGPGGLGDLGVPQAADVNSLLNNVGAIKNNTGKIAKTVDLSDEQLKMMVDIAERKFVNNINLTSQAPVITVQGQNTGNTEADRQSLADLLGKPVHIEFEQGIGVLMANSLMFQRFPNHNGYDDPQFSSFYGQTLPLLKRGIPVELVHMENTPFKETFKGLHILVMSYSNMKPMKLEYHNYLADWVKKGGILIYCGEDIDPYQTVLEWWNTDGNEYKAPSEHLFEKMNLSRNPGEGTYRYGKGTVIVMREDPKHFVLKAGNDQKYFETIASAYQKKQGIEIETKNSFIVERGPYTIAAVMDESVSKEPLTLSGLYIDLFDKDLPVLTSKQIQPGEQGYLYDLNKVSNKIKAKVLCGASRIYDEKVSKQSYSFVAKSPINTTNVSRVLLPRKPEKIRVNGKEEQPEWDESSKTLLLSFENDPAGVNVSIEW